MYFAIIRSKANHQYYFQIKSANHEIIAQSEGYLYKQGATNAINVIKANATNASVYDFSEQTSTIG